MERKRKEGRKYMYIMAMQLIKNMCMVDAPGKKLSGNFDTKKVPPITPMTYMTTTLGIRTCKQCVCVCVRAYVCVCTLTRFRLYFESSYVVSLIYVLKC